MLAELLNRDKQPKIMYSTINFSKTLTVRATSCSTF